MARSIGDGPTPQSPKRFPKKPRQAKRAQVIRRVSARQFRKDKTVPTLQWFYWPDFIARA
jgi:hypothetical protein